MSIHTAELQDMIRTSHEFETALAQRSIRHYLQSVVIASSPTPKPFGEIAEPWQREILYPKVPAFEYLTGYNPTYEGPLSFATFLPRGHDKSSLEGRLLSWTLVASRNPIRGYVVAADRDQGKLIIQAMADEAKLNPWLAEKLDFKGTKVLGPAGFVEVIPADVGSAFGLRGNLYVCDEITNWGHKGQQMWAAIASGREKVPGSLLVILSNAGTQDSWQHELRLSIERDKDWVLFERRGQLATWMNRERVEALARLLPPFEAARVFENEWIDPASEFDYLRRSEVVACVEESSKRGLLIRMRREPEVDNYVAGIDYGARRDRTALCVVHFTEGREVIVDRLDVWQGNPENPVEIPRVEEWIHEIERTFKPVTWVVDPSNLEGTVQWMEKRGLPVERFAPRGGAGNYELAQHLRALIVNRQLLWYPTAGNLWVDATNIKPAHMESFADELIGLRVKKMPYGFRFDHENQKHDDRSVAVGMASLRAVEYHPSTKLPSGRYAKPLKSSSRYTFPVFATDTSVARGSSE